MTAASAIPEKAQDTLAQAVYQEFKDRPIVITAALSQFSEALNNRYPELQIDVLTTTLNSPNYVTEKQIILDGGPQGTPIEGEVAVIAGYTTTPLFEVMIYSITAKAQLYFTREHFLSDATNQRIEVDMREIEDLLRRLPKVMIAALQQALTDYWNEPAVAGTSRWQWLSDVVRSALLVSMGPSGSGSSLDKEQADTLLQVLYCPTKESRLTHFGQNCAQAFLIDYQARFGRTYKATLSYNVLVTRTVAGREVVLCFEPGGAIESYDSLQAFADSEGSLWGRRQELHTLELQPYESLGDVFVTQVQALLNNQLEGLNFFGPFEGQDLAALEQRYARLTDLAPHLLKQTSGPYEQMLYAEVDSQLPDWLQRAEPAEAQAYSRCMFRLAALQQVTKGQSYSHGIQTAEQFARDALLAGMSAYGQTIDPDELEVIQYRNEDGQLVIIGTGTGRFTSETQTLTRRALNNLGGLPFLASEFRLKDGSPAPAWVNLDTLRDLISAVDIGKNYPADIKKRLLDDPVQRAEREKLFIDQLRIQLPMLALENRIKKQSGFTDMGYRYVTAAMEPELEARRVSGQEIVIRPLAFNSDVASQTHVVANMFVFGPKDVTVGPHILYRPLYSEKLIEFASLSALMEEIVSNTLRPALVEPSDDQANPSLQKSILDWLAPDVRKIYDNGGFQEPHPVGIIFGGDLLPSTPARFDVQVLSGDLLAHLYEANAKVLAQLADEQTLSNAEYRWATLIGLGWSVFNGVLNAVLPFVSGPAAAIGWLFVMETSVLQALQSLAEGDSEPTQDLSYNLLINLAVAVLIHRLSIGSAVPIASYEHPSIVRRPGVAEVKTIMKPPIGSAVSKAITDSALNFATPICANSRQLLERFLILFPDGKGPVITAPALPGIVVLDGRWYAKVRPSVAGNGWARVSPAEGKKVVILDNKGDPIQWLELKKNLKNDEWDVAPEFKVRGGGPGMSRYLSDVFADSQLRTRRETNASRVKVLDTRAATVERELIPARDAANMALQKARSKADEINAHIENMKSLTDSALSAAVNKLETLRKELRNADLECKKKTRVYLDGHKTCSQWLEEAVKILKTDKDYNREAIIDNLNNTVLSYGTLEETLHVMSAIWPELGFTEKDVFPLHYQSMSAVTEAPYSGILEARERVIKALPERIKVSEKLESAMAELEKLDRSTRKGLTWQTGYLSKPVKLLRDITDKRPKTTDQIRVTELVSLRGALAGDPAVEPSLAEITSLEGLSTMELGNRSLALLTLNSTEGFTATQRIGLLQEAVSTYNDAEHLAKILLKGDGSTTYVPQKFLKEFLRVLGDFRNIAEKELSDSILEDVQQASGSIDIEQPTQAVPKKPRKRIKRPKERLINTSGGYRVGDAQEITPSEPDETVAVKDSYTGKDIIYYRHEGEDLYRQRIVDEPKEPVVSKPVPGLPRLVKTGQNLLNGVNKLIVEYKRDGYLYREPASLEDRFLAQAKKMSDIALDLNSKMQNATGDDRAAAIRVYQGLKQASGQLIKEGKTLRINATKQLPPTAGSLQYLLEQGEVHVGTSSWTDKSTSSEADFLLEYEILDSTSRSGKKIVWYAHFHCAAKNVLALREAHLKMSRLRFKTVKDQLKDAGGDPGAVVYPGTLQSEFAKKYFFVPHPPTP